MKTLKNMNEKDINEYMKAIVESKGVGITGLELDVFQRMGLAYQSANKASEDIRNIEDQQKQLAQNLKDAVARANQAQGEVQGLANILALAEDFRRTPTAAVPNGMLTVVPEAPVT